jgi:hypothetical protein
MQSAFLKSEILEGIERQKISDRPPMALNLPPDKIWIHPKYGNIDASVGCVKDMYSLLLSGIKVTTLTLKR